MMANTDSSSNGSSAQRRLVPRGKGDDEACVNLLHASDQDIYPYIYELLECLQDLNWPVAEPVADRLMLLDIELVEPIIRVLNTDDDVWKYWLVSYFLYQVKPSVYQRLILQLNRIKTSPTAGEIAEHVHEEVCELLSKRGAD